MEGAEVVLYALRELLPVCVAASVYRDVGNRDAAAAEDARTRLAGVVLASKHPPSVAMQIHGDRSGPTPKRARELPQIVEVEAIPLCQRRRRRACHSDRKDRAQKCANSRHAR